VVSFIDSVGTGLFLGGSTLFFTLALHLSAAQVGLGLSLAGGTGFLCTVPFGRLADRFGARRTLVALQLWRGLCFVAYPFVSGLVPFLVLACFIGAAEFAVGPIAQAVVGVAESSDSRVRTMAAITAVRNIGFTAGALLATLIIALNDIDAYRALVLADAASFFLAAGMLARLPLRERARPVDEPGERSEGRRVPNARFIVLAACNGVLYLHTVVLTVGLPLWVITRTAAPRTVVGAVVVLNTVLAVALQVRLSKGAEGLLPAAVRQRRAGLCLAAFCGLVGLTSEVDGTVATALIMVSVVALTLGEIWQSVGGWGVSYALSPEEQRSFYLSAYNLGATGASVAGPSLLTAGVIMLGMAGWLGLGAVFAVVGLVIPLIASGAGRSVSRSSQPAPS
jgi:MFS family permease